MNCPLSGPVIMCRVSRFAILEPVASGAVVPLVLSALPMRDFARGCCSQKCCDILRRCQRLSEPPGAAVLRLIRMNWSKLFQTLAVSQCFMRFILPRFVFAAFNFLSVLLLILMKGYRLLTASRTEDTILLPISRPIAQQRSHHCPNDWL